MNFLKSPRTDTIYRTLPLTSRPHTDSLYGQPTVTIPKATVDSVLPKAVNQNFLEVDWLSITLGSNKGLGVDVLSLSSSALSHSSVYPTTTNNWWSIARLPSKSSHSLS